TDSGAVYVFVKRTAMQGGWNCFTIGCRDYVAKINPPPVQAGFGAGVAISGDGNTIAVLSETLGTPDSSAGIIWVYVKPGTGWASTSAQAAILSLHGGDNGEEPCANTDLDPNDCNTDFSSSIAINNDGSTVVLGYSGALVGGISRGAAYVYVKPGTGWVDNAFPLKLTRSNGAHLDNLGQAVAISSDDTTIAAAAPLANGYLGAVDVFVKGGSGWANGTQNAELTYAPGDGLLFLGNSVDITSDGSTIVAGGNGRVHIFPEPSVPICGRQGCFAFLVWTNRSEAAQLTASDGNGIAYPRISGNGNLIVAAAVAAPSTPGTLYLFARPTNGWVSATSDSLVPSDSASNDYLGMSFQPGAPAIGVDGGGNTILVGASGATIGSKANQGAAYLFLPEPSLASGLAAALAMVAGLAPRRRWSR